MVSLKHTSKAHSQSKPQCHTGGSQRHAPAALPPGKNPGIRYTGDWVCHTAGLKWRGKNILPLPRFEHQTVQLVASRNSDYAVLVPSCYYLYIKQKLIFV
jgi:hypothetical protein